MPVLCAARAFRRHTLAQKPAETATQSLEGHTHMGSWPLLFALVLVVPPVWKILSRVGYSGWWSLLALIPIVNLIALWMFAFGQWPQSPR
jgi:hypothetical protein